MLWVGPVRLLCFQHDIEQRVFGCRQPDVHAWYPSCLLQFPDRDMCLLWPTWAGIGLCALVLPDERI